MCSLWGTIANPHVKDLPSTPKSHPWGMTPATEWKFCSICFLSFICKNAHKVWYKNLRIWQCSRNLMIFDLLTSAQGHQFDLRMILYLHSVLLVIPLDLMYHMIMFEKKKIRPPGPQRPKVPLLGHDPGEEWKSCQIGFCIFHLWEHTQSLV